LRPYLKKNPSQKGAGGVAQDVGPEFKLQYLKKKKFNQILSCPVKNHPMEEKMVSFFQCWGSNPESHVC
jgi:hypothetical protein